MSAPRKIEACDWSLTDDEAKEQYRIAPSQEWAIQRILEEAGRSNGALLADDMGVGKAQPLDALVLTPSGFLRMGDIMVGQKIVSPDGRVEVVSGVFPQGERPVYRVTLRDGRVVEADEDHIWTVTTTNRMKRGGAPIHRTTAQLRDTLTYGGFGNASWYIEAVEPVDLGAWSSSIDPYLLGLLLGDGGLTTNTPVLTTADPEILDDATRLLPPGIEARRADHISYRLSGRRPHANALTVELRRLGIMGQDSHTKFVPAQLLHSSVADRLSLLQGLLDTDGAPSNGGYEFISASPKLAEAVRWLTHSLGGRCTLTTKMVNGKAFNRVRGRLAPQFAPFRLARKMAKMPIESKYRIGALAIASIEYVGMKPTQCIMVDSDLHEYVTDGFVRTHNTLQSVEVAIRGGFKRALFITLPDTHDSFAERLALQSDGRIEARVMNGTAAGLANLKRFMAGEDGFYLAGAAFLAEKDFESRPVVNPEHHAIDNPSAAPYLFKTHKSTNTLKNQYKGDLVLRDRKEGPLLGEMVLRDRNEGEIGPAQYPERVTKGTRLGIGPAQEPVILTKSTRINYYDYRLKKHPLDLVVFDEVHAIANRHAQARRTILTLSKGAFVLSMSGTWFLNDVDNMWSIATFTWRGTNPETGEDYVESNHKVWATRYLEDAPVLREDGTPMHAPSGRELRKITGEREPGAFIATLPCYIRREAADPIPTPEYIYVDPTPEQAAQMEDLQKDLMTWVMAWDGQEEPLVTDMPAELHTRLRQIAIAELSFDEYGEVAMAPTAASAKLTPIRGLLEKVWPGQNVAILTDSKIGAKFLEARMRRAGVNVRAWHGDLSKKQRAELKASYLAGEFPYLIATIQSFGVGIDGFQRVCDKVIWVSKVDGNPALNDQGIRRFVRPHRLKRDGVDQFQHVELLMNDSPDVETMQSLIHKSWIIRQSITIQAAA